MKNEQQLSREQTAAPLSYREYWSNPTGFPKPTRRTIQRGSSTNLFEHATSLPLGARAALPTREGISQPALPFTWYTAETAKERREMTDPAQPLKELQQRVEQRGVQTLSHA